MRFETLGRLDDRLWPAALELYHEAFPKGSKPDRIIEATFEKGFGLLYAGLEENGRMDAMAFAGIARETNALLIDYLAVREELRGRGIGARFVAEIVRDARERKLDGIIIEAEADPEPDNLARIRFWERCGFTATEYVHQYVWVPEPYRALYLSFGTNPNFPTDGKELFRHIGGFHSLAFRGSRQDRQ